MRARLIRFAFLAMTAVGVAWWLLAQRQSSSPVPADQPVATSSETGDPRADEPASPLGRKIEDFALRDFNNREYRLSEFSNSPVVVVVFLGTECPLAHLYAPRLVELARHYSARGVTFLGIDSNLQDSTAKLAHYFRTHQLNFPLVKDPGSLVADTFGARRTPEAFVLDAERRVQYWGRIDDQYGFQSGVGYQRPQATRRDLAEAIDDLLASRAVRRPLTVAPGCLIGRARPADSASPVTWSKQIAPIFQRHCQGCHRPGEIGPFPLLTYEDVHGWAEMIAEVVREHRMPPWHANPDYGKFANDKSLSREERELLAEWVRRGAPEGNPADLPSPIEIATNQEDNGDAKPDLTLYMSEEPFDVPAEGLIEYQYFFASPEFSTGKWVRNVRAVPGNRSVVHHITVYYRRPGDEWNQLLLGKVTLLTGYLPGQGTTDGPPSAPDASFSSPSVGSGAEAVGSAAPPAAAVGSAAPGGELKTAPVELGQFVYLPPYTEFMFEIHYSANGRPQQDRSRVELWFADPRQVKRELYYVVAQNGLFEIPPQNSDYTVEASYTFDEDSLLSAMTPHMHLRGRSFRFELIEPTGQREVLLDVPHFDFNWQTSYFLVEPRLVKTGSQIHCVARYDNSSDNLANPNPEVAVRVGDQTKDEMMTGTLAMSRDLRHDPTLDAPPTLDEQLLASAPPELAAGGAEKFLWAHRVESAYERGKVRFKKDDWQRAVDDFTLVIDAAPAYRTALMHRGRARVMLGLLAEAEQDFLRSMEVNPNTVSRAHAYLANLKTKQGNSEAATEQLKLAIAADPGNIEARCELGKLQMNRGELDQAAAEVSQAVERQPNLISSLRLLAEIRLLQKQPDEAAKLYIRAIELVSQQPEAYLGLGLARSQQRRFDEALDCFDAAIRLAPRLAPAYAKRGLVQHLQKRDTEALADLQRAIELNPKDDQAHLHLGLILASQHRERDALTAFQHALDVAPEDVNAANGAAWIAATSRDETLRDGQLAVRLAEQACRSTNYQRAGLLDTLAAAYAEQGDFEKAIATAHQALALTEKTSDTLLKNRVIARLEIFKSGQPYRE